METAVRADAVRILAKSPLFEGLERSVVTEMVDNLTLVRWPPHAAVMTPTETLSHFYVLLRGRVKITRGNPRTGREVTLFLLGPGDGFNVLGLLDNRPHLVNAEALDSVEAVSGPTALWNSWLDRYPAFRTSLRRHLLTRMRELSELAGDLALHDTMTRLAHLILRYFDGIDPNMPPRPDLIKDLSHEELAHMIGTVRVVVNRLLGELKREGIIDTQGGELHVRDLAKLLRKAEQRVQSV
jgi:CRP/FNR family transcriptional regulator, cyclic AMP receptor protein